MADKRDKMIGKFIRAHDPERRRARPKPEVGSAYRNRIPTPGLPPSAWPVKR